MATHKFPGVADKSLYLERFVTNIGTGGVKQRLAVIDQLDEAHVDQIAAAYAWSGVLDAPEEIPTGGLEKAPYRPSYCVATRPTYTLRPVA